MNQMMGMINNLQEGLFRLEKKISGNESVL